MSKTLLDDFWSAEESIEQEKAKLQRARINLSKKVLELSYIEEFRTRLIYVRDLLQTDCSNTETFAQRYLILLAFVLFDDFEQIALGQHPSEQDFIRSYWAYMKLCCEDALKIECTQAVNDGIPRMIESLRSAWTSRTVPEFQSFQIEYDTPLPEEPVKRKPVPRGSRKTKQVKKEEAYHHLNNASGVVSLLDMCNNAHMTHRATARVHREVDNAGWLCNVHSQRLPIVHQCAGDKQALVRGDFTLILACCNLALHAGTEEQQ